MGTINRTTLETILKASKVASNDETRVYLCGVCLEKEGDKLSIVATNGHALVRHLVNDSNLGDILGEKQLIIYNGEMKHLKSLLKDNKHVDEFKCEYINEHKLKIDKFEIELVNREYPRYKTILCRNNMRKKDNVKSISLDADLLLDLVKSCEGESSNTKNYVTLFFTEDTLSPIVAVTNNLTLDEAIIMPIKAEREL